MATTETTAKTLIAPSALVLGKPGEFWDFWLIIAVIIAAIAAVLIGLTTAASTISHKREAERSAWELDQYKLTVDAKVAEARQEGIRAGATASDALARAAEFQMAAEEARAVAATAQLETERLRAKLQWRSIPKEVRDCLASSLAQLPSKTVQIAWIAGDPEARWFADQIAIVFHAAGWQIAGQALMITDSIPTGMSIPSGPTDTGDKLRSAFKNCGLPTFDYAIPPAIMTVGNGAPPGADVVFVGIRPGAVDLGD